MTITAEKVGGAQGFVATLTTLVDGDSRAFQISIEGAGGVTKEGAYLDDFAEADARIARVASDLGARFGMPWAPEGAPQRVDARPTSVTALIDGGAVPTIPARIIVIGDSLSDQHTQWGNRLSGQTPLPSLGYWNGRFTNGKNWVDYLREDLAPYQGPILNFAVGGSWVEPPTYRRFPSLAAATTLGVTPIAATQYANYIQGASQRVPVGDGTGDFVMLPPDVTNDALFLFVGANDLMNWSSLGSDGGRPGAVATGRRIGRAIASVADTAWAAGTRQFVLVAVPDLSLTPKYRNDPERSRWSADAAFAANTVLIEKVSRLNAARGTAVYVPLDDYIQSFRQELGARYLPYLNTLATSPNMNQVVLPCHEEGAADQRSPWQQRLSVPYRDWPCNFSTAAADGSVSNFMFLDPVHPSTIAQCGIAGLIENQMHALYPGIPGAPDLVARVDQCSRRSQASRWHEKEFEGRVPFTTILSPTAGTSATACTAVCAGIAGTGWTFANRWAPSPGGGSGYCGCQPRVANASGDHPPYAGADLTGQNLSGRDFTGEDFTGATLTNTNLNGSNLTDAIFTNANMTSTNLAGATLAGVESDGVTASAPPNLPPGFQLLSGYLVGPGASASGARFTGTSALRGVDLTAANLTGVDFTGSDLTGTVLGAASLQGATFTGATLSNSDLGFANLDGVASGAVAGLPRALPYGWRLFGGYLLGPAAAPVRPAPDTGADGGTPGDASVNGANLPGATLTGLDLAGAYLAGANLAGSSLQGVDLSNADLAGANLTGADLTGATLTGADLTNANLTGVSSGGIGLEAEPWTFSSSGSASGTATPTNPGDAVVLSYAGWQQAPSTTKSYTFQAVAAESGTFTFGWTYTCSTDFYSATAQARAFTTASDGTVTTFNLFSNMGYSRGFLGHAPPCGTTGSSSLTVTKGQVFGFTISNQYNRVPEPDLLRSGPSPGSAGPFIDSQGVLTVTRTNADLRSARLADTTLAGVNLSSANLGGASLMGADFSNANVMGANMAGADLSAADFTGANLSGATLTSTSLGDANLASATLANIVSGGIGLGVGAAPSLPPDWTLSDGYLVAPNGSVNAGSVPSVADWGWGSVSNVSLAGGGNVAAVAAGSTVSVSASYSASSGLVGCPGCITQVVVGTAGSAQCLFSGLTPVQSSSTVTLTAPSAPGTYVVWANRDWEYGCQNAINNLGGGQPVGLLEVYTSPLSWGWGNVSAIAINGSTAPLAHVAPGATATVTGSYFVNAAAAGCPDCITEVVMGVNHGTSACLVAANSGWGNASGSFSTTLTAPTLPGVYKVWASPIWDNTCADAVVGVNDGPPAAYISVP